MRTRSPIRGAFRRLGRLALGLRFRLLQRHRHDRVVLERVEGEPILVLPGVMNPVIFMTGEMLASTLGPEWIPPGSRVLDMGTGSGVAAVFAARWAGTVVAVDINPHAIRCARLNVILHELEEQVDVRRGDLFGPVGDETFDVVLFNPPYLPGEPRTPFERTLRSDDTIQRFAADLARHLSHHGVALVILSSVADEAAHLEHFRSRGFEAEPVARRDVIAEVLTVYGIRRA